MNNNSERMILDHTERYDNPSLAGVFRCLHQLAEGKALVYQHAVEWSSLVSGWFLVRRVGFSLASSNHAQ